MTFLLSLLAMLCLCLSMTRHQRDVLSRPLADRLSLGVRYAGYILLALSFAAAWGGGSIRVVGWLGELSVAVLVAAGAATLAAMRKSGGTKRAGRSRRDGVG